MNEEIRFTIGQCSLGSILVAQSAKGLCAIFMGDDADELKQALQSRFPKAHLLDGTAELEHVIVKFVDAVDAMAPDSYLPSFRGCDGT